MKEIKSEIVFKGHHDKLADQLSDALLMEMMKENPKIKSNIKVTGGLDTVFITGIISQETSINFNKVILDYLGNLGYSKESTNIINEVKVMQNEQEMKDYSEVVVYGYATKETEEKLPKGMVFLKKLASNYDNLTKENEHFLPDGKAIMTGLYDEHRNLIKIKNININHQNTGQNKDYIHNKIQNIVLDLADKMNIELDSIELNPYGSYLKGGFERDTGLTGRKHVIDSYLGLAPTNWLTLSGKDIYNVRRSGTYKARKLAETLLDKEDLEYCNVEICYDKEKPVGINISSDKGEIKNPEVFLNECEVNTIIEDLGLLEENLVNRAIFGQTK